MQIPSRFSIAIHICLCVEFFNQDSSFNANTDKKHCKKMTGEALAESVGVNSVIVRNILASLKSAGLISIFRGSNGAKLSKNPSDISLLDIFYAVESTKKDLSQKRNAKEAHYKLFRFHANPSELCLLGKNIHNLLDSHFDNAQNALEAYFASVKLDSLLETLKERTL